MKEIKVIKIERVQHSNDPKGWVILANYSNESQTYFGTWMSEAGSKRMLNVRAKQFGLTVNDSHTCAT